MTDGSAKVSFDWADDTFTFKLGIAELQELQDKTGCGPEEMFARLRILDSDRGGISASINAGLLRPGAYDLHHVIRLGLIGGGMKPVEALKLTRKWVDDRPRSENYVPAQRIVCAAIVGAPDDPIKKAAAAKEGQTVQTDESSLPPSTGPEPQ